MPLPGGGGGPLCGGGAVPAGVSPGPGNMCSINSFLVFPNTPNPFPFFRTATIFIAFPSVASPPLTLAVIGVATGPGGPGGGCPLP